MSVENGSPFHSSQPWELLLVDWELPRSSQSPGLHRPFCSTLERTPKIPVGVRGVIKSEVSQVGRDRAARSRLHAAVEMLCEPVGSVKGYNARGHAAMIMLASDTANVPHRLQITGGTSVRTAETSFSLQRRAIFLVVLAADKRIGTPTFRELFVPSLARCSSWRACTRVRGSRADLRLCSHGRKSRVQRSGLEDRIFGLPSCGAW